MRRAAKVDANHAEIVKALKAVGCSVLDLSALGSGCPDLCVGRAGVTYLMELKSSASGRDRHNRADQAHQIAWLESWRGGQALIVRSVDEAMAVVRAVKTDYGPVWDLKREEGQR